MVLFNIRHRESFPIKTLLGLNPRKFSPANLSTFVIVIVNVTHPAILQILWIELKLLCFVLG